MTEPRTAGDRATPVGRLLERVEIRAQQFARLADDPYSGGTEAVDAALLRELAAELTTLREAQARLHADRDNYKRMYNEVREGVRSGFLDRAEAADATVAALVTERDALRESFREWRELNNQKVAALERERDEVVQRIEAIVYAYEGHQVPEDQRDKPFVKRAVAFRAALEREVARLKEPCDCCRISCANGCRCS